MQRAALLARLDQDGVGVVGQALDEVGDEFLVAVRLFDLLPQDFVAGLDDALLEQFVAVRMNHPKLKKGSLLDGA